MNKFKELLGDLITDETAKQLDAIVEAAIDEKVLVLKSEHELTESKLAEVTTELTTLKEGKQAEIDSAVSLALTEEVDRVTHELNEKHEAELIVAKDEVSTELTEQFSQEKAELEATFAEKEVALKEAAQKYGEHLIAEAEKEIVPQLNEAVANFKSQHEKQFELLEDYQRMQSAFVSVKQAFEQHGLQLNEEAAYQSLQNELLEEREYAQQLQIQLTEAAKREKLVERDLAFSEITKDVSDIQRDKLKKLAESISLDGKTIDDFKAVLEVLVERTIPSTSTKSSDTVNTVIEVPNGPEPVVPATVVLNEEKEKVSKIKMI